MPEFIKVCLFFFSFGLYFTVNTLFYTDSTMHKIYEDNGSFDFIYMNYNHCLDKMKK